MTNLLVRIIGNLNLSHLGLGNLKRTIVQSVIQSLNLTLLSH